MIPALIFLAAIQDPPPPVESRVRATLSGRLEVEGVYRDGRLNEASLWIPGGYDAGATHRKSETFISPLISIRLDLAFAEGLDAVLEIGNQRIDYDTESPMFQNQRDAPDISVLQAFLTLETWPLEWTVGVMEFERDPSGWGDPIFLSSHSESPWGELPDRTVPAFSTSTVPQTRRDEFQPAGIRVRYRGDPLEAQLWALTVIEGGAESDDEWLCGAEVSYPFEIADGTLTTGLIATLQTGENDLLGGRQRVGTVGGWIRYEFGSIDSFLEVYKQFGDAGRGEGRDESLTAKGFAFRLGARIKLETQLDPWLAFTVLWVSGDESALDGEEGRFLSYEDNDATLIVEGNEFGLDIDSNYWALRFAAGASLRGLYPIPPVDLATTFSFFRLIEEIPLPPDPAFGISDRSDALGIEWDFRAKFPISAALSVDVAFATLFSSGVLEQFTLRGDDFTYLLLVGTRLIF